MDRAMYNEQSRKFQDAFGTRRLADRLVELIVRSQFNDEDREFIHNQSMFFLATANADGFPDCSYKGGAPGFVQVIDDETLVFPSYDGNGMFKSVGNIAASSRVGLLFLDFENPRRLRVNGTATVSANDPLLNRFLGAQLIIRVHAHQIFVNCPRYIHRMQMAERSTHVPAEGATAPIPDWKKLPPIQAVLPANDPARLEN